ncbi:MAG: DUF3576 domain-containing protein [Nitrospira sp. CR1.1]|nr:DUF3576 domain-containing protein [Nitrospira sp. CR1.1]
MQRAHVFIATTAFLTMGCASLSGSHEQTYSCSQDVVWDAAMDTMKSYSITSQDKTKGVIETGWLEMDGKERSYGIFGRTGFGNRERARMSLVVKTSNGAVSVSVLETRQRWHSRGGVTSQATKWWPVEPSEEATTEVTTRLNEKLQEQGCSPL